MNTERGKEIIISYGNLSSSSSLSSIKLYVDMKVGLGGGVLTYIHTNMNNYYFIIIKVINGQLQSYLFHL